VPVVSRCYQLLPLFRVRQTARERGQAALEIGTDAFVVGVEMTGRTLREAGILGDKVC
jgi:hypothetical protein